MAGGVVIGIDPDLTASGVGVVEDGVLVAMHSLSFFDLLEFVAANRSAQFVIEDLDRNRFLYGRHNNQGQKKMQKIMQNVGQARAVYRLLVEYMERERLQYIPVMPLTGAVKQAKNDADFFNRLTGWDGPSNQDKRDAALLAIYGPGAPAANSLARLMAKASKAAGGSW